MLELSPNSIRKASQKVGKIVAAHEQVLHERSRSLEAQRTQHRKVVKPARLYGSLDGFMVLLQNGWHEMEAGTWWTTKRTTQGEIKAQAMTYYTDYCLHRISLIWFGRLDLNTKPTKPKN